MSHINMQYEFTQNKLNKKEYRIISQINYLDMPSNK